MKNEMNIGFTSKFHLLSSQENSEEIIWSCSDSSDYETTHKENSLNISNKIINRKRKRANKKLIKTSNLDINFTDSEDKTLSSKKTSYLEKYNTSKSPIICPRNVKTETSSPIILLKHASPLPSVKIKKKLFETNLQGSRKIKSEGCVNYCGQNENETNKESKGNLTNIFESSNNLDGFDHCNPEEDHIIKNTGDRKLIEKVKSYFDSHFSSQSTQHSISECETESSRSIELEITSSLTPTALSMKPNSSSDSLRSFHLETGTKSKKARYKKNGLSYRLNSLLKKQNASFSLWHHEKFLSVNSNFVIPREEFIVLQIVNVNSKYGSFLLETKDSNSRKYLILINNMYINNNVFEQNAIFKLYKPFRVIDFDIHYKLVVNVCKFECTGFTS